MHKKRVRVYDACTFDFVAWFFPERGYFPAFPHYALGIGSTSQFFTHPLSQS